MSSSSNIVDAMNNISIEDEEEEGLAIDGEELNNNIHGLTGFNAKLCVVARFISEDMPLIGYPFTWERCRGTENWVEVRLDRALVSESFLHLFKGAKLINLEVSTSDHCHILLEPDDCSSVRTVKPFRFENAWLRSRVGGEKDWKKKWSNISLIFSKLLTLN
ncbi:hypothetical protein POM88_046643 [Heracleum sosnowskyi]|uniref:Uncharacterized protein n=1 Tax=Heracleum sosnowskyi TaxID=360622 RepID=A0AAD8H7Y8_9APIA|nr:hypothetical protein POM88_046643 [Heracleum sosnowskyi]